MSQGVSVAACDLIRVKDAGRTLMSASAPWRMLDA